MADNPATTRKAPAAKPAPKSQAARPVKAAPKPQPKPQAEAPAGKPARPEVVKPAAKGGEAKAPSKPRTAAPQSPSIEDIIAQAEREGLDEVAVGNLDAIREVNDVRDIVRAYRLLMTSGRPGEVYNVGSGIGFTMRAVAQRLLAMSTRTLETRTDPALARPADVPMLVADVARLVTATGWEPKYTIDDTLADVLAAARANLG